MPTAPRHPCPACGELTATQFCAAHQIEHVRRQGQRRAEFDRLRGSAAARGYDYRWQKYSANYLRENPWCVTHRKRNLYVPATHTDHIVPHRGDPRLFWDRGNHQGLCESCHNQKTAGQDGGFGNPRK